MELKELKHKSCPMCRSRVIMIYQKNQHSNGHWNEKIEFLCGSIIEFSPNFMWEKTTIECPHNPIEIEKSKKRDIATKKLEKYIARLDVDEAFKSHITVYGLRIY